MGYADFMKGILTSVINLVAGTASFDSSRAIADFLKSLEGLSYPVAFIRLIEDRPEPRGPKLTEHYITYRIEIHHRGTGTKSDLDSLLDYSGEVIDAVESDRTLGNANIQNTEYMRGNFSYRPTPTAIFYYCYVELRIRAIRQA